MLTVKEESLQLVGDAIREKTGTSELLEFPNGMVEAINGIEAGGNGAELPEEFFTVSGTCNYRFAYNNMNYLLENEPYASKWQCEEITNGTYMFKESNELIKIPFSIKMKIGSASSASYINGMFDSCYALKELPDLDTEVYADGVSNLFKGCRCLREIPQSWYDNLNFGYINNQTYPSCSGVFTGCFSLRKIDSNFIKNCRGKDTTTSSSGSICYGGFQNCRVLDEIVGLPTIGKMTSNMFSSTFYYCYRLKDVIFDTNEDGTVKTAEWKSQTIDLVNNIGYHGDASFITGYNSGITADKEVNDDATYQALKDDPDWFATKSAYSRYNHDSAVNTINSLPDTSAYLATAGGTNTIKFRGAAGSLTDGGAINTLTEEEIAVAAAKGWTVTLA